MKNHNLLSFTIDYDNNYNNNAIRGTDIEQRPWNLSEIIIKNSGLNKILLDVGCGDGHKLLSLSKYFKKIIGIDCNSKMIKAAKEKLKSDSIYNINFFMEDSSQLSFEKEKFDVVTCMLSRWVPEELHRVLKPKGVLIIEHLGCEDKYSLKNYFKSLEEMHPRGQYLEYSREEYLDRFKIEFEKLFDIVEIKNGFWKTKYTREGIRLLLKHTPTVKNYDEIEDYMNLEKAIRDLSINEAREEIILEQNRVLLMAIKK